MPSPSSHSPGTLPAQVTPPHLFQKPGPVPLEIPSLAHTGGKNIPGLEQQGDGSHLRGRRYKSQGAMKQVEIPPPPGFYSRGGAG